MTRDEAIQKALKLLKLSESSNPHEAALAAQRAQEILLKFQITETMLGDETIQEKEEEIKDFTYTNPLEKMNIRMTRWKSQLASVVSRANQCRIYICNQSTIGIVGRESDVNTVRYLYQALCFEVDSLAKRYASGNGKSYSNNFRFGVVDAIAIKLKEAKENIQKEMHQEASNTGTSMIKLDNAIAKIKQKDLAVEHWLDNNLRLRKGGQTTMNHNAQARAAGQRAGSAINLGSRGGIGASKGRIGG